MSFTRRNFLIGAGSGLSLLVMTACTDGTPSPSPTPTQTPTGTPAVAAPSAVLRSSWSADTFARGSHSFIAVGSSPDSRTALAQPLVDRVFFAGEATSAEHAASVLGARQSGARAASEVSAASEPGERVAVIGAGAAGSEAARLLTLFGYDVVVIEARDRTGGRIHSVVADEWPIPAELGAWRLSETADADVLDQLQRLGVTSAMVGGSVFRSSDPAAPANDPAAEPDAQVTENTVGIAAIDTAIAWAASQAEDVSLLEAVDQSGAAATAGGTDLLGLGGTALLDQQLDSLAADYGAAASEISGWYAMDRPIEPTYAVTGNYSELVTNSLDGVETFLSTAVVGIAYSADGVSLRLATGESLSVDRAIVTVPLGVLKSNDIDFDPLLPFAHRSAINTLGVGTVDSVWLRFDEKFWTTDATVWNLVGTENDITTWYNLLPLTGVPLLVGLVGGDAALRLAELDDDALVAAALASLEPFADA